jgi:hypothetical protein
LSPKLMDLVVFEYLYGGFDASSGWWISCLTPNTDVGIMREYISGWGTIQTLQYPVVIDRLIILTNMLPDLMDFTYKLIDRLYRIDRLIYIIKVYTILSIWLLFNVTDEYSLKYFNLFWCHTCFRLINLHKSVNRYVWNYSNSLCFYNK